MEFRQLQQQTLKLKMTTELRQAISILQFSSQELTDFIREQALENPLIELKEPTESLRYKKEKSPLGKRRVDPLNLIASAENNLKDDLLQQARWLSLDDKEFQIVSYLIMQLDDDGYFREDLEVISDELHCPFGTVLKALICLQTLEPTGIGARNLEECLLLQVNSNDYLTRELISNYLVEIAKGDLEGIQEQIGAPLDEIRSSVAQIQSLNPRPGMIDIKNRSQYIRPDLVVDRTINGYDIWLVDNGIPSVHMNHEYEHLINSSVKNDLTNYIQQKYRQYLWLVKSIGQRRTTLQNVGRSIINHQQRFLEWGPKAMAPLTLKEIANGLNIHESTVSRAIKQKYIQTPFGIFELKTFFPSRIKASSFGDISSRSVKVLIQELVESEDPEKPLSDQTIVDMLKESKGIDISRRAIAKYRNELKIPPSSKRKNQWLRKRI